MSRSDPYVLKPLTRAHTLHRAAAVATTSKQDRSLIWVILITAIVGLSALYWSYHNSFILAYNDSFSHLYIARRIFDSRSPGLAQFGTVWLPLPHMLLQPFIYNDTLWHNGLAGGIVGFLCFEGTAIALFLTAKLITQHKLVPWIAVAVLLSNPNAFYLQTTAMTEPVLLLFMTTSSYFLVRWAKREQHSDLLLAGIMAMGAIGSRYDGWFFAIVCSGLIALIVYSKWHDPARTEGITLAYAGLPCYAMFVWVFYNWLIFGDPLAFARGEFSDSHYQQQLTQQGLLPTKHNIVLSLQTYGWAVIDTVGVLVSIGALIGLVLYICRTRRRIEDLVFYSFFASFVFNVLSLWLGHSYITTPHTSPEGYFNMRYGIAVLPGCALLIAYLADALLLHVHRVLTATLILLLLIAQGVAWVPDWPHSLVTLQDGLTNVQTRDARPALYLRMHYQGGGILIDDAFHADFITQTHIDLHEYLTNGQEWHKALENPGPFVEWIVLVQGDRISAAFKQNVLFAREYHQVAKIATYTLFKRNTA